MPAYTQLWLLTGPDDSLQVMTNSLILLEAVPGRTVIVLKTLWLISAIILPFQKFPEKSSLCLIITALRHTDRDYPGIYTRELRIKKCDEAMRNDPHGVSISVLVASGGLHCQSVSVKTNLTYVRSSSRSFQLPRAITHTTAFGKLFELPAELC
jgi:hypothetical protein